MESEKYVWEVWSYGADRPVVKCYRLVRMNPKGGCTVLIRGHRRVIRPMTGKMFFTDEAKMLAVVRESMRLRLASHKSSAENLERDLGTSTLGLLIETVRSEAYESHTKVKL